MSLKFSLLTFVSLIFASLSADKKEAFCEPFNGKVQIGRDGNFTCGPPGSFFPDCHRSSDGSGITTGTGFFDPATTANPAPDCAE